MQWAKISMHSAWNPRNPRSDEIPGDDARGEEERGIKRDRKRTRDRNRTRDDARGGRK
jgi:hypothetical protein